nr:osteopetrosis-associated transmembrane protein 1 [Leptinotarsa decemlineata]
MNNKILIQFIFLFHQTLSSSANNACTILRNNFANASSQFTLCAVHNSRPITFCEQCVDPYRDVLAAYKNMTIEMFDNETKCIDIFINLDRLEIIETLYENNVALWNRAKCYECYRIENGTQSKVISNETIQFQEHYTNFMVCVNQTLKKDDLCGKCMQKYIVLSNFYNSISNNNEKIGLCMDLVDIMNTTWTFWGVNCCKYRKHNEYIFITISVVMLILTFVFYYTAQFYVEKKTPTILQQSRFVESLNTFGLQR